MDHPEHARKQRPVVARVAAQRGQERHNPLPLCITEFEAAAHEHLDEGRAVSRLERALAGASGRMAALGNGLVLPAEQRPAQTKRYVRHGLGQR